MRIPGGVDVVEEGLEALVADVLELVVMPRVAGVALGAEEAEEVATGAGEHGSVRRHLVPLDLSKKRRHISETAQQISETRRVPCSGAVAPDVAVRKEIVGAHCDDQ